MATESMASLDGEDTVDRLSMRYLFGAHFSIDDTERDTLSDPSLADARSFLLSFFGKHVTENDIEADPPLQQAFAENTAALKREYLESLFGRFGVKALLENQGKTIDSMATLNATITTKLELPKSNDSWLVEMPKIQPNRQTVHANPQPFVSECPYLPSSSRMLFTPSNVMRWGYHCGTDKFVSNSRVVRWSDGSLTLHIGQDVYTLNDWRSNAEVHLLGSETVIESNGMELPAFTANTVVSCHFVMDSAEAESVQKAVAEENETSSPENRLDQLGFPAQNLPSINWEKPTGKSGNTLQDFVSYHYEERRKKIMERYKNGRPMTLAEQMRMEEELAATLQAASENRIDLVEKMTQEVQMRPKPSQQKRGGKFDRSVELRGGMSAVDPLQEDEESEDYEEVLASMQNKREREFSDEVQNKKRKVESATSVKYLTETLEKLLKEFPTSSEIYGSVDGTLELLQTTSSFSMVAEEVQHIIRLAQRDHPLVDISELEQAAKNISE